MFRAAVFDMDGLLLDSERVIMRLGSSRRVRSALPFPGGGTWQSLVRRHNKPTHGWQSLSAATPCSARFGRRL